MGPGNIGGNCFFGGGGGRVWLFWCFAIIIDPHLCQHQLWSQPPLYALLATTLCFAFPPSSPSRSHCLRHLPLRFPIYHYLCLLHHSIYVYQYPKRSQVQKSLFYHIYFLYARLIIAPIVFHLKTLATSGYQTKCFHFSVTKYYLMIFLWYDSFWVVVRVRDYIILYLIDSYRKTWMLYATFATRVLSSLKILHGSIYVCGEGTFYTYKL